MLTAKSVDCLDAETGELIKRYHSIYAASAEVFGKKPTLMTAIVNCCKGRQKTAYGYKWVYSEEGENG